MTALDGRSKEAGVLLLNDADHLNLALCLQLLGCLVPPGHVPPAAGSPGGEDVQDQLATAEVRKRRRPAGLGVGQ